MQSHTFVRFVVAGSALLGAADFCPAQEYGEEPQNQWRNEMCTYFNDSEHDRVQGIALMPDGRILVAGETRSRFDQSSNQDWADAQTAGGFYLWANGSSSNAFTDGFVAILSADGTHLDRWAYIGGCDGDRAYYAEADANWIYVVGITKTIRDCNAATFPYDHLYGTSATGIIDFDVFVARLNHELTERYVIVIAGNMGVEETARGSLTLVKDSMTGLATSLYLSGKTESSMFPVGTGVNGLTQIPNTGQLDHMFDGSSDAFLARFDLSQSTTTNPFLPQWATFYGGSGDESAVANVRYRPGVEPEPPAVFIGGFTTSADMPLAGTPYDSVLNNGPTLPPIRSDGFIARFNANTGALTAATYLGGVADDNLGFNDNLELTPGGNVVVSGMTGSTNFPFTLNAHQSMHTNTGASADIFVTVISSSLSGPLLFSTYLGGGQVDEPSGLAVDNLGRIYLSGETKSTDFDITPDLAFDKYFTGATGMHLGGYADCFIVKLDPASTHPTRTLKYGSFFSGDTNQATPDLTNSNAPAHGARGRSLLYDAVTHTLILCGQTTTDDFPTTPGVEFRLYSAEEEGFVARHFAD